MAGEVGVSLEGWYAPLNMWIGIDCHPSDDGLSVYFRDVTAQRQTSPPGSGETAASDHE